ncbi:MAG: phage late control D family protein [Anaerolineae bacterium]
MARFPGYAPQHAIRIDGAPIPSAMKGSIISVHCDSSMEGADQVTVAIANQGFQWRDHPLLKPGKPFELALGYAPDPLPTLFGGEISGLESTFPLSGIPIITLTAHDRRQRLAQNRHDESHRRTTPSVNNFGVPDIDTIRKVAGSLNTQIDSVGGALSTLTDLAQTAANMALATPQVAQFGVRIQESMSDFDFLTKIAKDKGWEMYIDHSLAPHGLVLRFRSMTADFTPVATFKAGANLLDFAPRVTNVGDVAGVSARVWLESIKTEIVLIVSWDFERSSLRLKVQLGHRGPIGELLGGGDGRETIDIKPTSYESAVKQLLNELLPRLNNRLKGTGSVVGDPRVRPGEVVSIEGVGETFGGLYRVTSAKHSLDGSGYRTNFSVRQEPWFNDLKVPAGAAGLERALGQIGWRR